jgi:hypothetical protein
MGVEMRSNRSVVVCPLVLLFLNSLVTGDEFNDAALPMLKFRAVHAVPLSFDSLPDYSTTYGDFDLTGPKKETLKPLPGAVGERGVVHKIAHDAKRDRYFCIANHKLAEIHFKISHLETLNEPADVPELSWPCGIAFDSKRDRIVLVSLGGVGHMYSISPDDHKWSVISTLDNMDLSAFVYEPKRDCYYGLHRPHEGPEVLITKYNDAGTSVETVPLSLSFPDRFGEPNREPIQLVAAQGSLVLISTDKIYLIDPETGDTRATRP